MKDILSKLFGFFKYILLIIAFGLVLYGIMVTYSRLEKSLMEAINVFVPFGLVLVTFLLTLILGSKKISKNLMFNFVCCLTFTVTIIVCIRAMFDKNMILYYRYQLNYNPAYFADNLSAIEVMLYMIAASNIFLLISDLLTRKKKIKSIDEKKDKLQSE